MTRDTGAHIVYHLLGNHIALAHRPVAGLTGCACLNVHTVAEVDVCRNPVNAEPWNCLLLSCGSRYLLNVRTVGLYGLVTVHAETLSRKPHKVTRISVSVAGIAFQC